MNRLLIGKRVPVTCLLYGEQVIKEHGLLRKLSFNDKIVVDNFFKNSTIPTDFVGLYDRTVPSGYVINNETGQLYEVHAVNCQNVKSNSSKLVPNGVYHADIYRGSRLWNAFNLTDEFDNSRAEFFVKRPMHDHNKSEKIIKVGVRGELIGIYDTMFHFKVAGFPEPVGRAEHNLKFRGYFLTFTKWSFIFLLVISP